MKKRILKSNTFIEQPVHGTKTRKGKGCKQKIVLCISIYIIRGFQTDHFVFQLIQIYDFEVSTIIIRNMNTVLLLIEPVGKSNLKN